MFFLPFVFLFGKVQSEDVDIALQGEGLALCPGVLVRERNTDAKMFDGGIRPKLSKLSNT